MKYSPVLIGFVSLLLSACNTFEQNLEENMNATSTQSLNAKQKAQVDAFAEGGQLNSYEEQQMKESIDGNSP